MSEPSNEDRAGWGLLGLQAFTNRVFHAEVDRDLTRRDSFEQALSDMLGDLMHAVDQAEGEGWEDPVAEPGEAVMSLRSEDVREMFHRLVDRGADYFEEELAEERAEAVKQLGPCGYEWQSTYFRSITHVCGRESGHLEDGISHECVECQEVPRG